MTDAVATRELAITRVFDAPRDLVFRAFLEPEQLTRWWGKRGWNTPPESVTLDVRPGGAFRLNSISAEDGCEMPLDAVYREVVEPERLVFCRRNGDDAVTTVTFADLGDGRTEMTFHTTMRTSAAIREAARGGLQSAFDRLAELLDHPHDPGAPA